AMEAAEGGGAKRAAQREAEEFLRAKLAHGPVLKKEIEEEAEARNISVSGALRRAQKKLGVQAQKEKGRTDGGWLWELPSTPRQHNDRARHRRCARRVFCSPCTPSNNINNLLTLDCSPCSSSKVLQDVQDVH